jgi:methionyl-tRNA formyltransferase
MNSKSIVFLGSRFNVLEQLILCEDIDNIKIFALKGSLLELTLIEKSIPFAVFSMDSKKSFLDYLLVLDFDLLISNGCPLIFPVDKFKKHQILVNVHPTFLPYLQGKTPLNGVFYNKYDFYGATMHFIDKGIDTGDVIYQKRETLTSDIDLGLLYHLAMKLEGIVFKIGWEKLKRNNYKYVGYKQKGIPTFFNRTKEIQTIDFKMQSTEVLLLAIKSFGIETQGSLTTLENREYKIIEAEIIKHKPLLSMYKTSLPGKIILKYDNKMLVKTVDGIIKVRRFIELN